MQISSAISPLAARLAAANPVVAKASAPAAGTLHTFTSGVDGFDTNSYYYDTGKEVVVFDAQFTEPIARQLLADIRAHTTSPVRYVVITHPNPDKFNGARVFQQAGAKVVASEATARAIPGVYAYKKHYFVDATKMFTNDTYPAQATVDLEFKDHLDLPLQQGAVRLEELGQPGVSSNQTVALVRSDASAPHEFDALIAGDLVHYKTHAWLEGGIVNGVPTPTLDNWCRLLDDLNATGASEVYGGRGRPAPLGTAVEEEKAYLHGMQDLVTAYVHQHGAGPEAGKALADEAARAYPDYADPFMVQYSAYGLADQVAARQGGAVPAGPGSATGNP